MEKTIFEIKQMDCPSEENLIRLKLNGIPGIEKLDFDISNRTLTVYHNGHIEQIENSVLDLKLGGKKISSESTDQQDLQKDSIQKKLLWTVLAINFAFFLIEIYCALIVNNGRDIQVAFSSINI